MRLPTRSTLFTYTTLFRSRSFTRIAMCPIRVTIGLSGSFLVLEELFEREWRAAGEPLHVACRRAIGARREEARHTDRDRKSTRLNSSHSSITYAVFCLKKK